MRNLSEGDRGTDVVFAQKVYNKFAVPNSFDINYLTPDGDFGPLTKKGIKEFQSWYRSRFGAYGVNATGAIDSQTWSALGALPGASHRMKLIPQYNATTCWSACMSMLHGSGKCWDMPTGVLSADGGLLDDPVALACYASAVRRSLRPAPVSSLALRALVAVRPLIMLGRCGRYKGGGHAVIISAVWSETHGDEETAVVRILNPSPINRGCIEASTYHFMECEGDSFRPVHVLV